MFRKIPSSIFQSRNITKIATPRLFSSTSILPTQNIMQKAKMFSDVNSTIASLENELTTPKLELEQTQRDYEIITKKLTLANDRVSTISNKLSGLQKTKKEIDGILNYSLSDAEKVFIEKLISSFGDQKLKGRTNYWTDYLSKNERSILINNEKRFHDLSHSVFMDMLNEALSDYHVNLKIERAWTNYQVDDDGKEYHTGCGGSFPKIEIRIQNKDLFPDVELDLEPSLPGFSALKIFVKEKIDEQNLKIKKITADDFSILKKELFDPLMNSDKSFTRHRSCPQAIELLEKSFIESGRVVAIRDSGDIITAHKIVTPTRNKLFDDAAVKKIEQTRNEKPAHLTVSCNETLRLW